MRRINPQNADFKALVDNKTFVFAAQSASPMRGRTVHLSPGIHIKSIWLILSIAIFPTMEEPIQHP